MIITNLRVINLRKHKEAEFDFVNGINSIVGKNGAGKSTIVIAIGIALFNAYTNLTDFISYGQDSAVVSIRFIYQNKEYFILREFGKNSLCHLSIEGEFNKIQGVKEVYTYLTNLLGVDLKAYFLNVLRIQSSTITYPFITEASKRKLIFDDILGISEYNDIWEALREPQKLLETVRGKAVIELKLEQEKYGYIEKNLKEILEIQNVLLELEKQQASFDNFSEQIKERELIEKELKILDKESHELILSLAKNNSQLETLQQKKCYTCGAVLNSEDQIKMIDDLKYKLSFLLSKEQSNSERRKELNDRNSRLDNPNSLPDIKDNSLGIISLRERVKILQEFNNNWDSIGLETSQDKLNVFEAKLQRLARLRDGFRKLSQLLSDINTKKISYFSSEILSTLMDRDVVVKLSPQYELTFEFDNNTINFHQLSDGEMIMAGLSIRLAMIKLFSDWGFVILDEPAVNLDADARQLLVEKLGTLGFNQVFVISHSDEFESIVDKVIKL